MRSVASGPGEAATNKATERIVIRSLSDGELAHEARAMRKAASYAQGMADKLEREINRRRRLVRQAITKANEGD
jgi:hypothetical protein